MKYFKFEVNYYKFIYHIYKNHEKFQKDLWEICFPYFNDPDKLENNRSRLRDNYEIIPFYLKNSDFSSSHLFRIEKSKNNSVVVKFMSVDYHKNKKILKEKIRYLFIKHIRNFKLQNLNARKTIT